MVQGKYDIWCLKCSTWLDICIYLILYGCLPESSHINIKQIFLHHLRHKEKHITKSDVLWLSFSVYNSKDQLALETPLECVYLLTLSGVQSIMMNQWSSSTRTDARNLEAIMEGRSAANTYNLTDPPTLTHTLLTVYCV